MHRIEKEKTFPLLSLTREYNIVPTGQVKTRVQAFLEKLEIAKRYLIPKALDKHGLVRGQVTIRKAALRQIIDGYAREAGVRNLEKQIRKIMRRAAMHFAEDDSLDKLTIGPRDLEGYLEKPVFTADEIFEGVPGVVTGLAWTQVGGELLFIETLIMPGKGKLTVTGKLGDVMQESARAALTYAKANLKTLGIKKELFEQRDIHIHVPAGAIPKDGPSAGIAMASAPLSPPLATSSERCG